MTNKTKLTVTIKDLENIRVYQIRYFILFSFTIGMAFTFRKELLPDATAKPIQSDRVIYVKTTKTPVIVIRPTVTPERTPTKTLKPTAVFTPFAGEKRNGPLKVFTVRISWYWPALGGTNCHNANWIEGLCRTKLLGQPWSDWAGVGTACPPSIPLKSRIYIDRLKRSYYCVDRGGAIDDLKDGTKFVDLLQDRAPTFPDWDLGIIVDQFCPRGCYISEAWILE